LAVRVENVVAARAQHRGRVAQRGSLRLARHASERIGRGTRRASELLHPDRESFADFPLCRAHHTSLSKISTRSSLWIISSRPRYPKIASMSFERRPAIARLSSAE